MNDLHLVLKCFDKMLDRENPLETVFETCHFWKIFSGGMKRIEVSKFRKIVAIVKRISLQFTVDMHVDIWI